MNLDFNRTDVSSIVSVDVERRTGWFPLKKKKIRPVVLKNASCRATWRPIVTSSGLLSVMPQWTFCD
eukprot:scaffold430434_cov18-Prasinocladus_malaysianus.AAC.2